MMQVRNPAFLADGRIDCEIEHPVFGWVPFTAAANDVEELGAQVFAAAAPTAVPYVEPEPDIGAIAAAVRAERTARLGASDWTQIADAPVDRPAWAAYRQALRDVPEQPGFPAEIVWPVAP